MVVRFGPFVLDSEQRRLIGRHGDLHLTPKAFDLLQLLIDQAPRVIRKTEIHAQLWPRTFVSDSALVALVKEIRRVLSDSDVGSGMVRTAHRVGYAFGGDLSNGKDSWQGGSPDQAAVAEPRDATLTILLELDGGTRCHARIRFAHGSALLLSGALDNSSEPPHD